MKKPDEYNSRPSRPTDPDEETVVRSFRARLDLGNTVSSALVVWSPDEVRALVSVIESAPGSVTERGKRLPALRRLRTSLRVPGAPFSKQDVKDIEDALETLPRTT